MITILPLPSEPAESLRVQIKDFHSEDTMLNQFLKRKAQKHSRELISKTYIVLDEDALVGYFSLLADHLQATEIIRSQFGKGKLYSNYPAVKIGRLAVNERMAGKGYGSIVMDAIKHEFGINEQKLGIRYISTDAKNVPLTINFYQKHGFQFLTKEDAYDDTRMMYFDLLEYRNQD